MPARPRQRVGELLALTRERRRRPTACRKWLNACDGSARCSDACPEDINVRQWVTIAKLKALEADRPREEGATNAANRFRHMAQAVRLLASMQLPSETLKKILAPAERRTADVLFYTGCNVLRTPHIVLNVMDILDALELDFDVVGGTAHCCGVYQFQEADLPTYERMGHRTFQRFGQSGASKVLTWCPTCTKNFDELEKDVEEPSFDLGHVSEFLAANLDALKARFVADQPRRRVVIHEHLGIGATVSSIAQAAGARCPISSCSSCRRIPASPMPAAGRPPSSRSASRRSIARWPRARSRPAPTPSSPCTIPAIARWPAPRRSIR